MTEAVVEFPRIKWEKQRKLGLDKGFKDALRDYCKQRWPYHTAKHAAREFDLTLDEGRGVAGGTASITTIEKCFKQGGPVVGVPVLEEVLGVSLAGFFRQALMISPEEVARAVDHEANAQAAYRALAADPSPAGEDRRTWPRPGEVGPDAPRRVAGRSASD